MFTIIGLGAWADDRGRRPSPEDARNKVEPKWTQRRTEAGCIIENRGPVCDEICGYGGTLQTNPRTRVLLVRFFLFFNLDEKQQLAFNLMRYLCQVPLPVAFQHLLGWPGCELKMLTITGLGS